jgi:NADH-quinone oxidoreductase subunit A
MSCDYLYVVLFGVIGIGFVVVTLLIAYFLRPYKPSPEKNSTYECGEIPVGEAHIRYNFRFYIFAVLFLLFDVEVVFLYPFAVKFRNFISEGLGTLVFIEIIIFILILVFGLIYAWKEGELKWV